MDGKIQILLSSAFWNSPAEPSKDYFFDDEPAAGVGG
jgi:hypothetical protein